MKEKCKGAVKMIMRKKSILVMLVAIAVAFSITPLFNTVRAQPVPHVVWGYIYDDQGNGVEGATVEVIAPMGTWTTTSLADGFYQVTISIISGVANLITVNAYYQGWEGTNSAVNTTYGSTQIDVTMYWYFKPATSGAPSGIPDFDQKQDAWQAYCGPTAVANCFWWYDSYDPRYDDLVEPEDVVSLITNLATYFGTDANGTNVYNMEAGIRQWFNDTGLNDTLYEHTEANPTFDYIEEELERCQDVILLLGFWQYQESGNATYEWVRIGGHYVTMAGVNSTGYTIALSDPFFDWAGTGNGPGRVLPPGHNCSAHAADPTNHNNPANVSQDFYTVNVSGTPPGVGNMWLPDYPVSLDPSLVVNFEGQNCPPEYLPDQYPWDGNVNNPVYTVVEYAVIISPIHRHDIDVFKTVWDPVINDWVDYLVTDIYTTVTFNISIHNNGTDDIVDVWVYDYLPDSLEYIPGTSKVNGVPREPDVILPGYLEWELGYNISPCEWIYIEFDCLVVACGANDTNIGAADGFCIVDNEYLYEEDDATVFGLPIIGIDVEKYVWNETLGDWDTFADIQYCTNATFLVTIHNTGIGNCSTLIVDIEDVLEPGLQFVDANPYPDEIITSRGKSRDVLLEEGFEGCKPGGIPPTWIVLTNDSYEYGTWTTETYYVHSGSYSVEGDPGSTYSVPHSDAWLISERRSLSSSPGDLTFWYRSESDYHWVKFHVLVSTSSDPYDYSAYTIVADLNASSTTWTQASINMDAYANQDVYIAWRMYDSDVGYYYMYIDDVALDGWTEGFEGLFPPAGWTVYDYDGQGDTWMLTDYSANTGNYSTRCAWDVPNDDWLVTPLIPLSNYTNTELHWYYKDDDYWDIDIEIWLCTTGNTPSDFLNNGVLLYDFDNPHADDEWHEGPTISLDGYGDAYIAFRYVSNNQLYAYIDDISITGEPAAPPPPPPPPGNYTILRWFDEVLEEDEWLNITIIAHAVGEHCEIDNNTVSVEGYNEILQQTVEDEDAVQVHIYRDITPPTTTKVIYGKYWVPPPKYRKNGGVPPVVDEPVVKIETEKGYYAPILQNVVWDNNMTYEALGSSQYDTYIPFESLLADDFMFTDETEVSAVSWIGGYWNPEQDGNFDIEITFYEDDGTGEKPGNVIASYYFDNSEVNETFIESPYYYSYYVTLPTSVVFDGNTKYWISIQGIGDFPPQWGWAMHTSPILLHESKFKSEYFGYPDWTDSSIVFGTAYDMCFQLLGAGAPPPPPPPAPSEVYITTNTTLCFYATDDISGVAYMVIEIWWDENDDGDKQPDEITTLVIYDNDPYDMDPSVGNVSYCLQLGEECYHEITYYSVDNYGNVEEAHVEIDHVDDSPPVVEKIIAGPGYENYTWITSDTLFTLVATDLPSPSCASGINATYYRIWYNGSWSDPILYEGPFHLEGNCAHAIEFWAIDNLGHESEHIVQEHFLDETLPDAWLVIDEDPTLIGEWGGFVTTESEFTIFASTEGCNGTSAPYIIYFAIEGPAGSKFYWENTYYPCDGTWHSGKIYQPIAFQIRDENGFAPSGKYYIRYYAENYLTGGEGPMYEKIFKIDVDPPEATISFDGEYYIEMERGEEIIYLLPSTKILFDAYDGEEYAGASGVKLIKYRIDDNGWIIYEHPFSIDEPGEHILSYFAKDWIGNRGDIITKTIFVDAYAPETNLGFNGETYEKENAVVVTPDTKITLTSHDESHIKRIYYVVDGSKYEYTAPFTLLPGEHTIMYYAEDMLGNVETGKYATIVVDNSGPTLIVDSPRAHYLYIAGREIVPIPKKLNIDVVIIGALNIKAMANDESTVVKMELYIDGNKEMETNENTISWLWDEKTLFVHDVEIKAYDYFGHTASVKIEALVFNLL